jgi:TolA-binding protein
MTCARIADLDFVERYVLGQMDEAEQASFEAHFFECPDCFAAVQAMQTAQSVLRESPSQQTAQPQPAPTQSGPAGTPNRVVDFNTHPARGKNGDASGSGRTGPRLLASGATWIGLAAAASLAGVMIWSPWRAHGPDDQPPQQQGPVAAQHTPTPDPNVGKPTPGTSTTPSSTTSQPSGTGTAPKSTPVRSLITLDTLALVAPPPYIPLQTRGADGGSGEAFTAAMAKYSAKDYRGAIDGLKPIVETQPDAAHAAFYLGVSYLAAGEPAAASAVLNRVAAGNVAPFADEAHFYLAKAALRARDLDRAERELSLAVERQAGPQGEAGKLLQALRLYRREHAQN